MPFRFQCPYCQSSIAADEEWLGMEANCPSCGKKIIIEKTEKQKAPTNLTTIHENNPKVRHNEDNLKQKNSSTDAHYYSIIDSSEDKFVLRSINGFKLINNIVTCVLCVLLFFGALIAFSNRWYPLAISLLVAILPIYYYWLLFNLVLSWFRGIYRNIMCLRVIFQSVPVSKVSPEK